MSGQSPRPLKPQVYGSSIGNVLSPSHPYTNLAASPSMLVSESGWGGGPGSGPAHGGLGHGLPGGAGRDILPKFGPFQGGDYGQSGEPMRRGTAGDLRGYQLDDMNLGSSGWGTSPNPTMGGGYEWGYGVSGETAPPQQQSSSGVGDGWYHGADGSWYYYGTPQSQPTDNRIPGASSGFHFPFN